jgi:hypothetical protein
MTAELCPISLGAILLVCSDLPAEERAVVEAITGEAYNSDAAAIRASNFPGPAWAIEADGMPIVVGGFIPQRKGVYQTWFYATNTAWERHGRRVTWIVRDLILRMLVEHAHRIETVTLADRSRARRWYETIGLQHESTLPGYGASREDAVLYVALKQEKA